MKNKLTIRPAWFLILGLILSSCSGRIPSFDPTSLLPRFREQSPTYTPIIFLPTLQTSPTLTVAPSLTLAVPPTASSTVTLTPIPSATPSSTPVQYPHIFPLQPPSAADFAEGTASHGYPATDIFAVVGTRFVAVTEGTVDFVSSLDTWDPARDDPALRGGLSVAIIGDDGLRYYGSHLSAIADDIAPGVRVKAGQLLGLVGNSGDARTTLSHLHFGISRPTTPDDWKSRRGQVDPYPFLLAWLKGTNLTPLLPDPSLASPTSTPNLYPHLFPLDPPSAANFSQGGHPFPATDIFAPIGTKFIAVTNGTISEVQTVDLWDPSHPDKSVEGGLSVLLLGDDGMRYYGAHLSRIAPGIQPGLWVAAGKLLGLVGDTGDARTTMPHLHFEISIPAAPFTKLDPFSYLNYWLHGENITPSLPVP